MLQRQLLRDELTREIALGQKSWKELKEKWRKIFLELKLPEMKEDVQNMIGCFERWLDSKNYQLNVLIEEIDEFNDQYNYISQGQVAALDRLIGLYLQRINRLKSDYDKELNAMLNKAKADFKVITDEEMETEENMRAMLYQMEMNRNRDEDLMNCDMFLKLDDERSKNAEKWEMLRSMLENKMERIWAQISGTLMEYQNSTERRRKHFLRLRAKDEKDTKLIRYQTRKIQKLYDQILDYKRMQDKDYKPTLTQAMLEYVDLKAERTKFFSAFKYLKDVMAEEAKQDEYQLKELIYNANGTLDFLQNFSKKGERIVSLFAICRKLETEKEKVVVVGGSTQPVNLEEIPEKSSKGMDDEFLNKQPESDKEEHKLENFWKKVAKVNISRLGLLKYIQDTEKENECLKEILLKYLERMAKES